MSHKKNKKRLIKALRSGDYTQGRNYLLRNDKYCCLGVLEDLHLQDKGVNAADRFDRMDCMSLPAAKNVEAFIGVASDNPIVDFPQDISKKKLRKLGFREEDLVEVKRKNLSSYERITCSELNDDFALNFEQIADIFEKYELA